MTARALLVGAILAAIPCVVHAQEGELDDRLVALTYHKVSGKPLDTKAAADRSDAARRASNFDRPDVVRAEAERLAQEAAAVDPRHEFVVRVGDNVSQYDHARGQFAVQLFTPGMYVQAEAFGQQYEIVFDNAESARAIVMPKAQARDFDARLDQLGRAVVDEIRFRIVGDGDPTGAVTGPLVVRATLLAVRVLDRDGAVLFTPTLSAPANAPAVATGAPPAFDAARADVAGLKVGVKSKDLEATLARLFGPVSRVGRGKDWFAGYAAALEVNSMGCFSLPGRRHGGEPGSVCVTAFLDGDDVVRGLRIERVFTYVDPETFRATLVRRYGAVSGAKQSNRYALGWGTEVDSALVYDRSGPHTALAAYYEADDDMMRSALNAAPRIRVTLQLVDAGWASSRKN